MSRNTKPHGPKLDRRVRRTRDALGDALVALVQEKPYGSITVQEVLERAEVSRAAFYTHFSGKDDLFLSDADEFFEAMAGQLSRAGDPRRVAPVREFLAHVAEVREFFAALVASGKAHDVLDLGRDHFARGIERRLGELGLAQELSDLARTAMAQGLAGAFLAQLMWWIRNGMPLTPEEMDEHFHDLVWRGLGSASRAPGRKVGVEPRPKRTR